MSAVDELAAALKPHVEAELMLITQAPVASIFASPTNPRKTFDAADLAELTESIRLHGVLQPILVRPVPDDEYIPVRPAYEVVAGERRWRAARAAGLTMIDVRVRDLSDREVLELQIVENLQRADLHPLEEADGYGRMMKSYGYTADDLAAKIGKSRAYIYGRLKLCDLGSEGRKAFSDGRITPSVALLIARVPTHRLQAELLLGLIEQEDELGDPASVREVQQIVRHNYMTDLSKAPFQPDDSTLTKAGSCYQCPNRTGNQPEIFDDVSDADVCTDTVCFGAKKTAHQMRVAAEARAKGLTVISGEEAKKVAPYGIRDFLTTDENAYVKVDAKFYEGEHTGKTFREILGGSVHVTLVEDPQSGVLVESMTAKALKDALIAAGAIPDTEKPKSTWEENHKKQIAKAEAETAYRVRLWEKVRERLANLSYGDPPAEGLRVIDRLVVARSWDCISTDCQMRLCNDMAGKSAAEKRGAMRDRILHAGRNELMLLAVEIAVSIDLYVNAYTGDRDPVMLHEAAMALGIDPVSVRREMAAGKALKPRKTTLASLAEESADKLGLKGRAGTASAKPGTVPMFSETPSAEVETADSSAETDSPAAKAVLSASSDVRAVKYRHPGTGSSWSGRGRRPTWVNQWLLEGNALKDLEAGATAPAAESEGGEIDIATNETPPAVEPETSYSADLGVNDLVRVKDTAVKYAGRIGRVERLNKIASGPPTNRPYWYVILQPAGRSDERSELFSADDLVLLEQAH